MTDARCDCGHDDAAHVNYFGNCRRADCDCARYTPEPLARAIRLSATLDRIARSEPANDAEALAAERRYADVELRLFAILDRFDAETFAAYARATR